MSVLKIKRTDGTWYTVEGTFTSTIVSILPTVGETGILYLVPITGTSNYTANLWKTVSGTEQWVTIGGTSSGGVVTDVQIDGTSIVVSGIANIPLSTKENISNKTTILTSASTDTQYPSAKVVYDEIQDVREVAEGKTSTYVISIVNNQSFNVETASITAAGVTDIDGNVIAATDMRKGDIIEVIELDVPDRWVGSIASGMATFYKMETAKASVSDVKQNGVSVVHNNIAAITTPTKLSDLTDDLGSSPTHTHSQYAESDDLAAVATSGAYDDLSGKPTIPTVGDATIIITQGGVEKGRFSTNQGGNAQTIALETGGTQSDWSETESTDPSYIQNKPTLANITFKRGTHTAATVGIYGPSQAQDIVIKDEIEIGDTQPTDTENELWLDTSVSSGTTWAQVVSLMLTSITNYNPNATQVLKNVNGTFQWVTEA